MRLARRSGWNVTAGLTALVALAVAMQLPTTTAGAATPLTVAQAVAQQNGASATVRGYVVGQPTATSTVVRSGFPNDYALALADTATETATSRMVYVQIPAAFRSAYGLRTNPGLLGRQLDVTGTLAAYFAHPGLTGATAFAPAGGTPPGTTTTTAAPPGGGGYYDSAAGLTGAALKAELNRIISTQTRLSYSQVWEALKVTDQDPANPANVVLLYSGRSQSKTSNGGGADDWNREHVWPQSHGDFGTATGPGTDVHHLRPEDVSVNSTRGNKDFDNGGGTVSECPDCFSDADSFEPRDAVKGDVARMMFYMAVRYAGADGWPDLELNDSVSNGGAPRLGRLSVLKQWHAQDPVDSFETRRNDTIYNQFQQNRNPFIDHPEWVTSIWP